MVMSKTQFALKPRAPFAGLPVASSPGRGVILHDRDGLGLATVLARKNAAETLPHRLRERFGIDLPRGPKRSSAGDVALIGTGPGAWLASKERGGNAFSVELREAIGDLASISDQSDGHAVLRLSGPKVRNTLYKLVPVDVHPSAFTIGHVAATVAAHIGVTLWRLDDGPDGSPVFEIAVYRAYAESFWHALTDSAAEFGIEVAP